MIKVGRSYSITLGSFIDHQNPSHPSSSPTASPLASVIWPESTLDIKKMILFSDDTNQEYTTHPWHLCRRMAKDARPERTRSMGIGDPHGSVAYVWDEQCGNLFHTGGGRTYRTEMRRGSRSVNFPPRARNQLRWQTSQPPSSLYRNSSFPVERGADTPWLSFWRSFDNV